MKSHRLPFENRWTSNAHAWEWNCELDCLGVPNVRAMFADHEVRHPDRRTIVFDIPVGFVRDWLAFQDRRAARQQLLMARDRHRALACRGHCGGAGRANPVKRISPRQTAT